MKRIYFLLGILLTMQSLQAQDCFPNFNYYRSMIIQPDAGQGMIAAHTIAITFDTKSLVDAEKLNVDGSDIRVVDQDCNPLPFFIHDLGNRVNNVLYVALPDLDAAGMEIQIYYGSTSGVSSVMDGSAVFLFFDDFEDGIIDTDAWENVGSYTSWEESDGMMNFVGDGSTGGIFQYVTTKASFTDPVTFDFAAPANNNKFYGICDISDIERVGFRYQSGAQSNDTMDIYAVLRDTINGGFFPGDYYPYIVVERDAGNIMSISATIDPSKTLIVDRFVNHSNGEFATDNLAVVTLEYDAMRPFFCSFGASTAIEFVGIRNTPQGFPIITTGPEVRITTSVDDLSAISSFDCFPNPVINTLQFKYDKLSKISIEINNNLGTQVHQQFDLESIDVSTWPSGWYIVKFTDGDSSVSKKILVN